MNIKHFYWLAGFRKLGFCLFLLLCDARSLLARQPNIILCMADDMGWGDPSYINNQAVLADGVTPHPDRGWIQTPTLDAMAANGLRFNRFYSASSVCSPTRASCLTGRNPYRLGIPNANQGRLEAEESALSEVLSGAGYTSGHFGKWHLGTCTTLRKDSNRGQVGNTADYAPPWQHGYDACLVTEAKVPTHFPYRKVGTSRPADFDDTVNFYGTFYWRNPTNLNAAAEGSIVSIAEIDPDPNLDGDDSKIVVDEALAFIADAVNNQGKPFFAVVWFHSPHKPVVDPLMPGNAAGLIRSLEDMDVALGRLRDGLDTLGVRSNTMFWVTSDNGPEDGVNAPNESDTVRSIRSGRLFRRKRSLHEGGLRVPGILEWPAVIPVGRVTEVPACTSDYYPTILDVLNLSVPGQRPLDGISLRPLIEGTASVRTAPMGFRYPSKKAWVSGDDKLIDDGSGQWAYYDLASDPYEQNPVSTNGNPSAVARYRELLAEYSAWESAVNNDTPYVHDSAPLVTLNTTASDAATPFVVTAAFSKTVRPLLVSEVVVENGVLSGFSGSGSNYTFMVSALQPGTVTVELPAGAVSDEFGNLNPGSNRISLPTVPLPGPGDRLVVTKLVPVAFQTVDSQDDVPGDDDNNLLKFTQGTINDGVANPFTTTLYVRGSTNADRTVRAFMRFDLSALPSLPLAAARLKFRGHALNNQNPADLQLAALAADWMETGAPLPQYDHPWFGNMIEGGAINTHLDLADHTKNFDIDLTDLTRNWMLGVYTNFGVQLRLNMETVNNGLGVALDGPDVMQLEIQQFALVLEVASSRNPNGDIELAWPSQPDLMYRIDTRADVHAPWQALATVPGSLGRRTVFVDRGAAASTDRRMYRVVQLR